MRTARYLILATLLIGTGSMSITTQATRQPAHLLLRAAPAQENLPHGVCFNLWFDKLRPSLGIPEVTRRVRALIRCAAGKLGFPGGYREMECIAAAESGDWPWAHSTSSYGVMQLNLRYWPARRNYMPRRWFPAWPPTVFNARANVLTAILLAHRDGLSPWNGDACV